MREVGMHGDPIDYIRNTLEERLDKQKSKGHPSILMGDINAHWDGVGATYSDLAAWSADSCLKSEIEDLCTTNMISLDTFFRGETPSQIDYILTS